MASHITVITWLALDIFTVDRILVGKRQVSTVASITMRLQSKNAPSQMHCMTATPALKDVFFFPRLRRVSS
jgi:hypothetical protein